MSVSHSAQYEPTRVDVWTVLKELPHRVRELLKHHESSRELGFEVLEQELHALFTHAECAATSEALEREDVDLPYVFIDGEKHHRVYRGEKTYLCAVGPVAAMRTLYRARPGERAVAAMERKVGIVEGYWTAHAARQGAMLTAHLVPREAEEVLGVLGNMTPSKSSLDRLPKALSARWEAQRPQFEARVREETLEVADTACTVAVSLDGVMAPMKTQGGGYREASCASVSLYDGEGERLSTVRMARMPQSKKVTLKTMVGAELEAVLGQRPDLQLVKIADGAKDNWTFLSRVLPEGVELIDFFHAAEHLKGALGCGLWGRRPQGDGAVREVSSSAAPRDRRRREGHPGTAPSVLRSIPSANGSRKCSVTSATTATAWATPRRRRRDCPSAPGWSRRRARPWSLSGSSVRACAGVSVAGRPF